MPPGLSELLLGLTLQGAGLVLCGFLGWCFWFDDDSKGMREARDD